MFLITLQGVLNGKYTGSTANVKSARVCSSIPGSEIVPINEDFIQNSNYRCGRKGVFLFPTEGKTTGVITFTCENEPGCERTNILVSDQVRHKPGCTATEDG